MSDTRSELDRMGRRSEALTDARLPEEVVLLEAIIDLTRSGFTNISGSSVVDDAQRLRIQLLNVSAACLESGFILATRGYYQPALGCARMILEHLSLFLFFQKFPQHVPKALSQDFTPAIADGFRHHKDSQVGQSMANAYDLLSKATHPKALSRAIGGGGSTYRISSFEESLARGAFGNLIEVGIRCVQILAEEVEAKNVAWVDRRSAVTLEWHSWRQTEEIRLANMRDEQSEDLARDQSPDEEGRNDFQSP
jgi:hypothetical protein